MIGLNALPEIQAIHAMQLLNQGTRNAVFLVTFLFTPIITSGCAVSLFFAKRRWSDYAIFLLAAVIVYFLGSFLPTVSINVPLNIALEHWCPARSRRRMLQASGQSIRLSGPIGTPSGRPWHWWLCCCPALRCISCHSHIDRRLNSIAANRRCHRFLS